MARLYFRREAMMKLVLLMQYRWNVMLFDDVLIMLLEKLSEDKCD
jgi:hypothetical protein